MEIEVTEGDQQKVKDSIQKSEEFISNSILNILNILKI